MQQVAQEDLQLPDSLAAEVDDALRTTLRRALQRSPQRRWPSAGEFRDALAAWLAPVAQADPADTAEASGKPASGALDFLLRRMRHNSDFPALSESVARIQRVANSESGNLDSLSAEILKDVALTGKLLRLVNTVRFKGAGGSIGTVSRAVALVGFNGIRNLAMSLVLLEHMHDKAHANQLQEEFLRSLLAGMLASELGTHGARQRAGLHRRDVPEPGPAADRVLLPAGGAPGARHRRRRRPPAGAAGDGRRRRVQRARPELRGAGPGRGQGLGPAAGAAGLHAQARRRGAGARTARRRRARALAGPCRQPGGRPAAAFATAAGCRAHRRAGQAPCACAGRGTGALRGRHRDRAPAADATWRSR